MLCRIAAAAIAETNDAHVVSTCSVAHQSEVVLMCGLAGAGKTTYAKHLEDQGYVRLSIGEELWHCFGRYGIDYPVERYGALSEIVEWRLRERLIACIARGVDVVVDYGFWKGQDRADYKALIDAHGGRWRLVYLHASSYELRRRLQLRSGRFDANAAFPIDEPLLNHYLARPPEHRLCAQMDRYGAFGSIATVRPCQTFPSQ